MLLFPEELIPVNKVKGLSLRPSISLMLLKLVIETSVIIFIQDHDKARSQYMGLVCAPAIHLPRALKLQA